MPQHVLRGLHRAIRLVFASFPHFASARPTRIASLRQTARVIFNSPLPQHVLRGLHRAEYYYFELPAYLCLSTSYADCIIDFESKTISGVALPQHVLRGLHHGFSLISINIGHFASARPTRIASRCADRLQWKLCLCLSTSYADCIGVLAVIVVKPAGLCLSTSYADCIGLAIRQRRPLHPLPQHVLRGLHRTPRLSSSHFGPLPQHVLRGLHRQKRTR